MADDVFGDDQSTESVLDTLVGEDKKFKTVEDLAKGKQASDQHIQTVEAENAELKEQLAKLQKDGEGQARLKDLVLAVEKAQQGSEAEGDKLSQDELIETIKTVMNTERSAETKAANRQKGNELVLKLVDGDVDAAKLLVTERARELGMRPVDLAELSETSPSAFARLLGGDKGTTQTDGGSTQSLPHQRTDAVDTSRAMEAQGQDGGVYKTKAWFDAKRKEVGHVAYINDQAIQRELARSINGLGERFNN